MMANGGAERDRYDAARLAAALGIANGFRLLERRAISGNRTPARPASHRGILNVTVWGLTAAIHGAFEAIALLCREGWGVESDVVLRQLQEAVVNARALSKSDSALFLYVEEIEKRASAVDAVSPLPRIPEALLPTKILGTPPRADGVAWYQSGKHTGKRRYWKDLTMETRVRLADLDSTVWYRFYQRLCLVVHSGPGALTSYLDRDDLFTLWFGPDPRRAFGSLTSACALMMVHLGTVDWLFDLGIGSEINGLGRKLSEFMPAEPE